MSKTVFRYDRGELRKPERTTQGFLKVEGRVARAGVYEYRREDGSIQRELRPDDEVFSPHALAGYEGVSITLGHPRRADGSPDDVTAHNVKRYEVGTVLGSARRDGEFVVATLLIKDAAAIKRVEEGQQELSPGYRIRLDPTPGVHPKYGRYDAVQRQYEINHQAVVDRARGGSEIRLRMDEAELVLRENPVPAASPRPALPAPCFAVPEDQALSIGDVGQVRDAMARFDAYRFADTTQRKAAFRRIVTRADALNMDTGAFATAHRADGKAVMTTAIDGHQHLIDCHEWNGCERSAGDTSWAVSAGAENGHSHPWIKDAYGQITIGESEGHTHGILDDAGARHSASPVVHGARADTQIDQSALRRDPAFMTTPNQSGGAAQPDQAEQVRLLTIRADEADRAVSEQRTRADAAAREAEGLRAELATARERISALNAQIAAGTATVETAAVLEQRQRADAAERELSQVRAQQPELVRRRAALVAKAQAVLPTLRCDGLTDREIVAQALRHLMPKEATGPEVSEDYMRRRLDAVIDDRAAYGASLSRASQTLATRPAAQHQNNQARADELPWADKWKGGLGPYSTTTRKD